MTKIEYIRKSHAVANRKLQVWLRGVYTGNNRIQLWLWMVASRVIWGVIWVIGWLAFAASLFRDVQFTLHFMECEIATLPPDGTREYLLRKQQEHVRRLSYGSVSAKEQKRIDKTFEYLFAKYPAPTKEPLPDMAAERHEQVLDGIGEVKTVLGGVTEYTNRKMQEDSERVKRESIAHIAAEKRREQHLIRKGFEAHPLDFSPKLSDAQFAVLAKGINEVGVFRCDVTTEELTHLFLCTHSEPLQVTHNKIIALLLEKLSSEKLITPKWQQVAADKQCFTSKYGKPLSAKDLSAAKQMAELISEKKYEKIVAAVEEVVSAR